MWMGSAGPWCPRAEATGRFRRESYARAVPCLAADGAARNNPPPRDGTTGWGSGKGVGEGAGSEEQEASHLRVALRQADPGEDRQRGGKEEPGILPPHLRRDRAAEVTGQQDGADERGARQGGEDRADQQRDADRDNGALRVAEVDAPLDGEARPEDLRHGVRHHEG